MWNVSHINCCTSLEQIQPTIMKLFRFIRRNSLIKHKNVQYLKYAIGEIILVIIGILIALQLNNWDENRKLRKKEVFYIRNVVEEIQSNNENIRDAIKTDSINMIDLSQMLYVLKNRNSKYNDSMSNDFYNIYEPKPFTTKSTKSTAYVSLKLNKLNQIIPDSIRETIYIVYDEYYPLLNDGYRKLSKEIREPIKNIMLRSFECKSPGKIIPNNYEELKQNNSFTNALSFYKNETTLLWAMRLVSYKLLKKHQLYLENYLAEIEN